MIGARWSCLWSVDCDRTGSVMFDGVLLFDWLSGCLWMLLGRCGGQVCVGGCCWLWCWLEGGQVVVRVLLGSLLCLGGRCHMNV